MRRPKLKLSKYSILFFLLVFFVVIEVLVISPKVLEIPDEDHIEYEKLKILSLNQKKDAVEQKMLGVHFVENSPTQKGWELFASEASGTTDSQWVLKIVKIQFFANDNSSFTVTGDVGEIDGATKDMVIRGHVQTLSSNGYSFKTDSLRYVAKNKTMISSDTVFMNGPPDNKGSGFKLKGVGLLVDLQKNKMTIQNQIEAQKVIDDKTFDLKSEIAEFSNKNQEAVFTGQVKMNYGSSLILSPKAFFTYSSKTKALEKILLNHNVKLLEIDKKATCDELEMNLLEDKMTLRGNPMIQQGEDEIYGQEIVLLEGGKKIKINQVDIKQKK